MKLMPIIVWCETYEDLRICEELTKDLYFTENGKEHTLEDVTFPCVFFKCEDVVQPNEYDYDLFERDRNYETKGFKSTIKEFKQDRYYDYSEEKGLTKIRPNEIKEKYPEYLI